MKLLLRLIIVFLFCMGSVGAQYRTGYDIFNLDPNEPIDQKKVTPVLRAFSLIYHPDKIVETSLKFPETERKKEKQLKESLEAAFKFGQSFFEIEKIRKMYKDREEEEIEEERKKYPMVDEVAGNVSTGDDKNRYMSTWTEEKRAEYEKQNAIFNERVAEIQKKLKDEAESKELKSIQVRLPALYYWFPADYATIPEPTKIGEPKEPIAEEVLPGFTGTAPEISRRLKQPMLRDSEAERVSKYLWEYVGGLSSVPHERSSVSTAVTIHRKVDFPKLLLGSEELTWDECVFRIIVWRVLVEDLLDEKSRTIPVNKGTYDTIPDLVRDLAEKILGKQGCALACLDSTQFADKSSEQLAAIINDVRRYKILSYSEEDLKKLANSMDDAAAIKGDDKYKSFYNNAFGTVVSQVNRVRSLFLKIFEPAYKMMRGKFFGSDFSDEAFVSMLKKMLDDFSIWDDAKSTFVFFEKCIKGYIEQRCGVIDELRYKKIIDDLKPYFERPKTLTVTILQDIIPPTANKPKTVRIVGSKASLADIALTTHSEENLFVVGEIVIVPTGPEPEYGIIKKISKEGYYDVGVGSEGKDLRYFKKWATPNLRRFGIYPLGLVGKLPASIALVSAELPTEEERKKKKAKEKEEEKAPGARATVGGASTGIEQLLDALRLLRQKLNDLSRALS